MDKAEVDFNIKGIAGLRVTVSSEAGTSQDLQKQTNLDELSESLTEKLKLDGENS